MEITGSVLTALFVGLVWALIKVVEFFVSKYKTKEYASLDPEHIKIITRIYDETNAIRSNLFKQENILREVFEHSKDLYEMHNVFNEDHVPAWYVSPDLIRITRENNIKFIDMLKKIGEVGNDQDVIVSKMSELITSQKLMTERLGDLIFALNKNSR